MVLVEATTQAHTQDFELTHPHIYPTYFLQECMKRWKNEGICAVEPQPQDLYDLGKEQGRSFDVVLVLKMYQISEALKQTTNNSLQCTFASKAFFFLTNGYTSLCTTVPKTTT